MTGTAGAHIQLFRGTCCSPMRWRLLSGNNREIGRGVPEFDDVETCRLAVKDLQYALDEVESSVRRTMSNEWTWELTRAGKSVAVSGRSFDRLIRCEQGLASFLRLIKYADIGATFMVSHARRWESPTPDNAARHRDRLRTSSTPW